MDDIQFSEFLDESIPLWRNDPVMFFREVLNFEPDEWQAEAARDLAANPKVSIKSGQGVGKTGLEAAVFLWFITCFPCLVAQDITTGSMRLLLKTMWNVSLSAKVMQTIWWSEARYPLEMPQL